MKRPLKGWWTVIFNAANAALLTMEVFEMKWSVPDQYVEAWMGVFIAANFVLRFMTDTPVGSGEK